METMFNTVIDGAKGLLIDTASILNEIQIEYVVIGGWCPMLRNTHADMIHPGTKDVDILFKDADVPHELSNVIKEFLNKGYLVSAKHDFQLFRVINIGGQELVFNIDILHPSESKENPGLFVDHFEFDFCENSALLKTKMMKSIVLPSSSIIFEGYYDQFEFKAQQIDGSYGSITIPLMNEAGLILSKCQSVKSAKRIRDAFDIYLVLSQENINATISSLSKIYQANEDIRFLLDDFQSYLREKPHVFNENVKKYCQESISIPSEFNPSTHVLNIMNKIAEQTVRQ